MTLQGKGFLAFNFSECEDGEPGSILAEAQAAGLSHVLVKIADGKRAIGIDAGGIDQTAPVVQALRTAGIAVWGWHSVYGDEPAAEADIAIARLQSLGLDGYVVDAEDEYCRPGMASAARQFMMAVRSALTVPIALSSYRFPNYHPELPWSTFLEFCDVHMPQVCWEQAHNAGAQLCESKRECDALPNARPYIPTGAAHAASGWKPSAEDIIEFLDTAVALGLPAVNFSDWENCRKDLPLLWTAITEFAWPAPAQTNLPGQTQISMPYPQPSPSAPLEAFPTQFMDGLNSHQAAQASALYDPAAIQVWADQILPGATAIQSGYATFFDSLPAGTVFCLSQADVEDDTLRLSWKAGPLSAETTLVLKNGKIILDYTFVS
jgi:hypothetical protein